MEFFLIFNGSVLPIFLIIGVAFFYNRLFHPDIKQITAVTLNIFAPIFVFESLIKHNVQFFHLGKPFVFSVILTCFLIVAGFLVFKFLKFSEEVKIPFILSVSMINIGNFGLPLIYFTFGESGVFYSILYFVCFNLFLSTLAIYISSDKLDVKGMLKDVMSIPLFHAFLVAMIFSFAGFKIPSGIDKGLSLLSNGAIPLLMFILGLQLSNIKFSKGYIYIILAAVAIRLVLSPAISFFVLKWINVTGLEAKVALVQSSGPSAILPLMYAIKFNRKPDLLAAIIFFTTLISGISLTILIKFVN